MIKQLFLPLAAVALFIIFVGLLTQNPAKIGLSKYLPTPTNFTQKTLTINGKNIQIEVADTEPLREEGLGGRSSLPQNSGMLFVFDSKQVSPTFWMKGMLIPLDIIWISDGKIVKIDKNVPIPKSGTPDNLLSVYSPNVLIDCVLEVNAGFSDQNGIKVGQSLSGL